MRPYMILALSLVLVLCVSKVLDAVFRVMERKYLDELEDKP